MDMTVLLALQSGRTPFLTWLFSWITQLGGQMFLMLALCALYWCLDKRAALYLAVNFLFGTLFNQVLKLSFRVERPWVRDARIQPVAGAVSAATGYSFPSGHTANATAFFGGLAVYYKKWWVSALGLVLLLLVAFSRLYLGVHTPQDVLVSLLAGVVLLYLSYKAFAWIEQNPRRDGLVLCAGLALAAGMTAFALCRPDQADAMKTAGGVCGLMLGWFWEKRRINFSTRATPAGQAFKLAGGLAVMLLLLGAAKAPLNQLLGAAWGGFARYGLILLFMLAIWPWMFTKIMAKAGEKDAQV